MRHLALAVLLFAPLASLGAQRRPYAQEGLGVSIEPHAGYTTFTSLYDGPVTFTAPGAGSATGTLAIEPNDMFSYGIALNLEPARSPFGLFADVSYGRGEIDATSCDDTGFCESGTSDLGALQVSLGLAARLTPPASPTVLRLHLGGNVTHLRLEEEEVREGYTNPGVLAGLSLEVPLWETVGVRLSAMNSFVRADTRSLEGDMTIDDTRASLETHWMNVARFGIGIRIGY